MSCWSVGQWPTSAGKNKTSFHGGPSSPQSNFFRFVPKTPGCWHSWVQMFPVPLEKVVSAAEWGVLVPFSDSYRLSGTGNSDCTLLQISFSQSVDHCDVPSDAVPRVPWQQRQTVSPLAIVTDQPMWFLHAGNAGSSQSVPDDSNPVGILHGCHL